MARRSPRTQELSEKNELSYMCGLFSILESCQGCPSRKMISNRRPMNKHSIDNPRRLDQIASFDEECRKIQTEAGLGSVSVDARAKENIVKRQRHAKMESELFDCLVKTHRRTKKSSQEAYRSSSCCLNNAASLIHQLPSASARVSLDKLTLGALSGPVCAQNHHEESKVSEYFRRSVHLGKYDQVDEINIEQIQMSAKDFVDQMFINGNFICKERTSTESKSFSDALEVLNSNKELFMKLLPDRDSLHESRIKKLSPAQTEKRTVKSILDAKFSYYKGPDASSSAKPESTLAMQKGETNKDFRKKINYQGQCSRKTNFAAQPSDKIVILKPARRNAKHSGNVTCHCSSMQSRVPDAKITSFSFREMKKKLKHTFGVTRKEPSLMLGTSDKLSQDRSTSGVGDVCTCRGVNISDSFNASTISKGNHKLLKKEDVNSKRGSDIACLTDSVRKKLDLSDIRFSNKPEFDVILEAKRHLSTRLKNINSVEAVTSKNSTKTLGRVLSSPEHDFWTLSPRRDSQYSGSAQMRFSPYNTCPRVTESCSQVPNGREKACLSPLRSNSELTSCDNHNKYDDTLWIMDAKRSSLIPSTEEEAYNTDFSMTGNIKSNGESKILETENILRPELHILEEVPSQLSSNDITRAMQITDTIDAENDDEIDSLSENEVITSTVDDFPSTPLSIYQLDMADSIKYQEEHQSPASVLEPFFIEDADSPPNSTLQTVRQLLQPLCLDFEECSFASSCIEEEYHLSQYVQLVMQASCLNWDQLSEITSPAEELLHASLFDEVEFPPADCYYDPKLLFDHINEVLVEIYKHYFCSPPWLAFTKRKIKSTPLAEQVLDEIMTESDFYLLPTTEKRTLDQLVSKDVANCRSWLDVQLDTEQIAIEISHDVLEESIFDTLLELHI